jgi:serine/threonine-protein kinase
VKVLDFGIARIREATASHLATGTGTTLGTPAFMAPEQALGNTAEVDARTDLWAVGATVFTLVSGVLVHEGETAPQMLVHAATRPARSLASVAGDAPPAVVDLVARALAFEKSARFGSALEMQAEVARVHEQLFGQGPSRDLLISSAGGVMPAVPRPSTPPSTAPVSVSNGVSASASAARSASQARAAVSAPDTAGTSAPRRTALISALAMGAAVLMGVVLWTLVRENAAGSAGPAQGSEPPVVTTAHAAPPPPPAPPPEDHVTVEPVQTASATPAVAVIPAASASASGQVPPHPQPAPRTRPARSADVRASTSPAPSVAPHNPLDMHLQ